MAEHIDDVLSNKNLLWGILESYIPGVLVKNLRREKIVELMNSEELSAYRNAIITKKLSAVAFYKNGLDWDAYVKTAKSDFKGTVTDLF